MKCYQCRYWVMDNDFRPHNEEEIGSRCMAPCSLASPRVVHGGDLSVDYLRWPHTDALDGCPLGRRIALRARIGWWLKDIKAWAGDTLLGAWGDDEDGD